MPQKVRRSKYGSIIAKRSQTLQRIGSCIVLVAVLLSITGVIFTSVAYGNSDEKQHVVGFFIAGPFLITLSVISFIIGFILFKMTESNLYWCSINCPNSKKETCICFLCLVCHIVVNHNSRGDNSRLQIPSPDSAPPKSILSQSGYDKHTEKQSHHHVRFDGYPDSDTTGSELSTSSTSLQRHCRVYPANESDVNGSASGGNKRSTFRREETDRPTSASDVKTVFVLNTQELPYTAL